MSDESDNALLQHMERDVHKGKVTGLDGQDSTQGRAETGGGII